MQTRDLRSDVSETLQRYPVVASVFDRRWVDAQLAAGFERGVHPMLDWLAAPAALQADRNRSLSTISRVITELRNEKGIGRLESRFARLKGKAQGKWQDNHREWRSTICELYLAAWLVSLGYPVRLGGGGEADIEVASNANGVFRIEVHAPRKGTGLDELITVLRWEDCRFGYDLHLHYSSDQLTFSERDFASLLGQIRTSYEAIESGREESVTIRFSNSAGSVQITVGPHRRGQIVWQEEAKATPRFSSLFPDIVERANTKAGKGQLREDIPSVLALEMGQYRPSVSWQHLLFGPGAVEGFPTEGLRSSVAAVVVFQLSLASVKPIALSVVENPESAWMHNDRFRQLLASLAERERETLG